MKPYHQHDSNFTPYLGSEVVQDCPIDYYSPQAGNPTVIARYGEDGDYYSSLFLIKNLLKQENTKESLKQRLKNISDKENSFDIFVLTKATWLAFEEGYLDENMNPVESSISKKLKIK